MKRLGMILVLVVFAGLYLIGCASPQQKAQALFNAGNYEQVVAQYGSDPSCAGLVADSKEKLAEKLLAEGKLAAVCEMYPGTKAAKEAENKMAEQLFAAGKFDEVIAKYPNSPFAAKARAEIERLKAEEEAKALETEKGKSTADATASLKAKNLKADAEFNKIMGIKMKDLRLKALKEFVAKAEFKGTAAVKKAEQELNK